VFRQSRRCLTRAFLGTAGWYRRFVKNFATLAAALSESLKKAGNTKFSLSPSATQAVDDLKLALTSAPVLVHADFKKHFYIQCDASHVGVGAVLFQRNQNGDEQPIAFFSAKMNKHQVNYSVTEKECLAAILAIWKFRPYVEGMPFTCITDHASLKWLMTMKDLSRRLARWSLQLQGYDFNIEHRKGSENVVADTLSRIIEEVRIDPTESASPVLLARDDYPGTGIRPGSRGVQGIQSAKLPDAGRNRKKGRDGEAIPETVHRFPGQVSDTPGYSSWWTTSPSTPS